ncbi:class I SAM-dependent methyltransferase [Haloechinothrix salitolerans]|uniref:Class I SAM-dependent methyltransferase n=1 Tax=Haloechinothrix salitolerans TaxID=926830 RepID=A0ABW2BYY5_9PSEU
MSQSILDQAFGHPSGGLGRIGGALMARGNAATERHVVDVAALAETDIVLVLGPGPGVGLRAAAERARHTTGVDPSEDMLRACVDRCRDLVHSGKVGVRDGSAEATGASDDAFDVVLSVNNVQLWDDIAAGLKEVHRVLRPGGRFVLSSHDKWLPLPRQELVAEVTAAGLTDVQSWTWQPSGLLASLAFQLRAAKPT